MVSVAFGLPPARRIPPQRVARRSGGGFRSAHIVRRAGEGYVPDRSMDKLFAPELVRCVADGRGPSGAELVTVARRVWTDSAAGRSAFDWDRLPERDAERVEALLIAQVAMAGGPKA
jgi:hypothetical protein